MSQSKIGPVGIILIIFGGGFLFLLILGIWGIMTLGSSVETGDEFSSDLVSGAKIGLIDIEGDLLVSEPVVRQLDQFRKSRGIRAVVLRVNTPGGGVAVSQEIYEAIKQVRNSGKPVVTSMSSVAASGGYYLALGSNLIVANPGTLTGSIGVIMQYPKLKNLMDKVGIEMVTIKSGKFKDTGNPFRELDASEQVYLQAVIDDAYNQFLEAVADGRGFSEKEARLVAEGKIYTGRQAWEVGLVDTLGTLNDALKLAANLAGIEGEPEVVKKQRAHSLLDLVLGSEEPAGQSLLKQMTASQPILQYRMYP